MCHVGIHQNFDKLRQGLLKEMSESAKLPRTSEQGSRPSIILVMRRHPLKTGKSVNLCYLDGMVCHQSINCIVVFCFIDPGAIIHHRWSCSKAAD